MWVVVGLGNPGSEYAETRHNLGFRVVDALLARCGARARRGAGEFVAAEVRIAATPVLLVKPTTYVNRTGRVLLQLGARTPVDPTRLLAIVDDVALPFGRLRLRPSGSAGGHNGLRSMIQALGAEGFPRLRLGVGTAPPGVALEDWVLGPFAAEEEREVPAFVDRAADAILRVVESGVEAAMPAVNGPMP